MAARKRSCICRFPECRATGDEATIRLPSGSSTREAWLTNVGIDLDDCDKVSGGRVSLAHFTPRDLSAQTVPEYPSVSAPIVRLNKGALPSQTSQDIKEAVVGALGRAMRWEAVARKLDCEKSDLSIKLSNKEAEVDRLKARLAQARADCKEAKGGGDGGHEDTRRRQGISYHILEELNQRQARSLCGLPGVKTLLAFYDIINYAGAADEMIFYAEETDEGAVEEEAMGVRGKGAKRKRKKVFRGVNGFFFALFLLRTATPIVVASSLFGVNETTGGRAFSTWVRFLAGALRPFVRLPSLGEVAAHAPKNFKAKGLSKCILVLDATELETTRVWQTDIAHMMWSTYKQRPTAKVMIGITPGGAICHISDAYGGRLTDTDVVRQSGLVAELVQAGFDNRGYSVMADRGFNPLGMDLTQAHIKLVAPPSKRARNGEQQFTRRDVEHTRSTANLRIHVERAIGALKEWDILHKKVSSKQLDMIPLYFQVCGSLVNMTRKAFASHR